MPGFGALARGAVVAFDAAVHLGAGLARGRPAIDTGQAGDALDEPEARRAAGRAAGGKPGGQIRGRLPDPFHAGGVGVRPQVVFQEHETARRAGLRPGEGGLDGFHTKQDYPAHPRRVGFEDPETGKTLVFLTHQMTLPAATLCALYKNRWQVELFFKWIKQHLRIKRFFGTSENAVKTPVSVYVLVAIVKKRLNLDASRYTLLQILSVTLFEKMPLQQAFPGSNSSSDNSTINNQLNLFAV